MHGRLFPLVRNISNISSFFTWDYFKQKVKLYNLIIRLNQTLNRIIRLSQQVSKYLEDLWDDEK